MVCSSRSSAASGSCVRPVWTGDIWMIVLRGDTSQRKRPRAGRAPIGPASSPPRQITGIVARLALIASTPPARRDAPRGLVGVVDGVPVAVEERRAHLLRHVVAERSVGDLVDVGPELRALLGEPVALVRRIQQQEREEGSRGRALAQPLLEAARDAIVAAPGALWSQGADTTSRTTLMPTGGRTKT